MVLKSYKKLAIRLFGKLGKRNENKFANLKPHLISADIKILLDEWISLTFFTTLIVFLAALIAVPTVGLLLGAGTILIVLLTIAVPLFAAGFTFLLFYIYPIQKEKKIGRNIELNMPFAVTHMASLSSSGLAPEHIFELITGFEEYGQISKQAGSILRNMKTFGMSSVEALRDVAGRCPSQPFRQLLSGIASTIESGSDLSKYLEEVAKESLFEYKNKREMYLKTLSTYADIYTAILVAAPLIFLAVLGIMGIIGGDVFGMSVEEVIFLVTWVVLPVLNIGFIGFIEMTHPGV